MSISPQRSQTHAAHSELDDPTHPLNQISQKIRDSIFKIHRAFGPGLLESAYEDCLFYDLNENQNLKAERQKSLPIQFEKLYIKNAYPQVADWDMSLNWSKTVYVALCSKHAVFRL